MAKKRKNDGELPESSSCKKQKKMKGKANFIISAAAAIFFPLFSFIINNNCSLKLRKKTPPSIDQLEVRNSAMVQFPEQILVNILTRLPVQSLVRFKCVSKFWITLISDPYFTKKHLNRARNDQDSQKLLIYQWGPKVSNFSLYCCPLSPVQQVKDVQKLKLDCPSTLKPNKILIHCCYNGLAILEICDKDGVKYLLWNPSIRESIVLPPLGCPGDGRSRFGLGYDSSSDEYKIIHMHQNREGPYCPNEILALKDGCSWRSIDEHPRAIRCWFHASDSLPFIHAAFHWIQVSRNYFVVISFDISNGVYGEIPFSDEILILKAGPDTVGLSVLEGMLCVYSNLFFTANATFVVWVLKEYGVKESWMALIVVKDTPYVYAAPRHRFADGEVLCWCLNRETRRHAFRMVSRSFRSWPRWVTRGHTSWMVSRPFKSWPRCDTIQGGHAFTESLISPKSLTYS
ncbi:F-box/kelch-repeat protein At3g23880-like [Solanum pennellii]|uniref:F-box/kelch-repeat protein At3g23880-like n=1 Tax=Solanum pennellii TaxID=28526 RepID=A0ABM1FHZ2_SOLPN|nr:F-box/kelch-repeat protein At3g23880-like [Solanum pennellii]